MTLRLYLIMMTLGTLLAWGALGLIVTSTDPSDTQFIVFAVFYAALILAVTGTLSVLGLATRVLLLKKNQVVSQQVVVSLRQAILLSFLVAAALMLESKSLFTWWNGALLIGAMTVLEFFFISAKVKS